MTKISFVFFILIPLISIHATPYDDGKYRPEKNRNHDNGRYIRPLNEGKYMRGDEGRYTYIYRQGLYPDDHGDYRYVHRGGPDDHGDYRYIHQDGPNGPDGSGGYDGFGGGFGPNGGLGPDGPGGPGGPNGPNDPYYLNNKIYAEKYKHFVFGDWIKNIIDKHVPSSYNAEQSENNYTKVSPEFKEQDIVNCTRYWNLRDLDTPERNLISSYRVQGEKSLVTSVSEIGKKLKFVYQVFVKVYEENDNE